MDDQVENHRSFVRDHLRVWLLAVALTAFGYLAYGLINALTTAAPFLYDMS